MATPAQIEANRRNALKSTGPRTDEGKDASRRNALTHGLAAETLMLPEEAEAVTARVAAFRPSLNPRGEYDEWLVVEIAVSTVRIDRCRAHEEALRSRSIARAASSWAEDREAEAEVLGRKLSRSPSLVASQLRRTKQGCAWLLARWEGLGQALEAKGAWTDAQKKLALDLLGTPKEFRDTPGPLDGDKPALVAEQVALLRAKQDGPMAELDEFDRHDALDGLGADLDKPVATIRRYEAANLRRMEVARKQLGKGRPASLPVAPKVVVALQPESLPPVVEPAPVRVDLAPPVANRKQRRALKARHRRS